LKKEIIEMKENLLTWIEISRKAYQNNIAFFRNLVGEKVEIFSVVKANAYGHGVQPIVQLALESGIQSFAVHALEEAMVVRSLAPVSTILIMGPVWGKEALHEIIEQEFRLAVFDEHILKDLETIANRLNKKAIIHLKINSGTNRLGIRPEKLASFLEMIESHPHIFLEGIYTHFANIEDTTDHSFAMHQLDTFRKSLQLIRQKFTISRVHTACSAATLLFKETHFNMIRLGISQYGMWPSRETFVSYKMQHSGNRMAHLQPILTWKTRIGQIFTVPSGECIGYGCTYKVTRPTVIATLPVGYSDGVDRRLSNNGYFLVRGQRAPVRGRICMNLTMIDVTDIPDVRTGDTVTLIGDDGNESVRADDWANWMHTINYEVTTRINPSIPKKIVD
jgi:alanine racemase